MTTKHDTADRLRKIAIFVATLDQNAADDLLDRLPEEQAAAVRNVVMQLDDVSEAEQEEVAAEILQGDAPRDEAPTQPTEASGVELDDSLASKLSSPNGYSDHLETAAEPSAPPFRFLGDAETDAIAKHLAHENPQVAAIVVAHLPPQQAADLVAHFDPARQADVLRRVSELDLTDAEVVRDIEQHLETLMSEDIRLARSRAAGLSAVSAILEAAGDKKSSLVGSLARHQGELVSSMRKVTSRTSPLAGKAAVRDASRKRNATSGPARSSPASRQTIDGPTPTSRRGDSSRPADSLTFDDLDKLSDLALARIFRASEPEIALLALTGAEPKFVDRLLRQLPRRDARSLRRRMESLGPLQLSDLGRAQEQIAELATRLARRGEIRVPGAKRFTAAA